MKRVYENPRMVVEQFEANEYIAACGDSGTVYKFECNAGSKWNSYHVYLNGPDGKAYTSDDIDWSARSGNLRTYSPCGATHEASTTDDFPAGYMHKVSGWNNKNTGNPISVIVWTDGGTNTHCTANLDMDSWETAKS